MIEIYLYGLSLYRLFYVFSLGSVWGKVWSGEWNVYICVQEVWSDAWWSAMFTHWGDVCGHIQVNTMVWDGRTLCTGILQGMSY